MKCFTHPQEDAVAQCSQCRKGTCRPCAHDLEGATFCPSCLRTGLREEIVHARRSVTGVWVFTGILTAISVIAAISSISQGSAGGILLVPLIFALSWCLFWGWLPVWNGFRRTFGGWAIFGSWFFLLIVAVFISELLVGIAILYGAFTGIQKYNTARRLVANGEQMLATM